jgi:hypothetical protein
VSGGAKAALGIALAIGLLLAVVLFLRHHSRELPRHEG